MSNENIIDWKAIVIATIIAVGLIGGSFVVAYSPLLGIGIAAAQRGADPASDSSMGGCGNTSGGREPGGSVSTPSCVTNNQAQTCRNRDTADKGLPSYCGGDPSPSTCSSGPTSCTETKTADIAADPLLIQSGDSSLISWQGPTPSPKAPLHSSSCTVTKQVGNGAEEPFASGQSGSQGSGPLTETTYFKVWCEGSCGPITDSVTVNVYNQNPDVLQPTASITANPSSVPARGVSDVMWTSTNAVACEVNGENGDGPWDGLAGQNVTAPLSNNTTYTVQCTDANGESVSDSVTVAVLPEEAEFSCSIPFNEWRRSHHFGGWPAYLIWCVSGNESGEGNFGPGRNNDSQQTPVFIPPQPSLQINATPLLVRTDETTTIRWTANNVESCTVNGENGDGPWGGVVSSRTSSPIGSEVTYTLACTTEGGDTLTDSVTVRILPTWQEI